MPFLRFCWFYLHNNSFLFHSSHVLWCALHFSAKTHNLWSNLHISNAGWCVYITLAGLEHFFLLINLRLRIHQWPHCWHKEFKFCSLIFKAFHDMNSAFFLIIFFCYAMYTFFFNQLSHPHDRVLYSQNLWCRVEKVCRLNTSFTS